MGVLVTPIRRRGEGGRSADREESLHKKERSAPSTLSQVDVSPSAEEGEKRENIGHSGGEEPPPRKGTVLP